MNREVNIRSIIRSLDRWISELAVSNHDRLQRAQLLCGDLFNRYKSTQLPIGDDGTATFDHSN
jgi:hypothetical protein